MDVELAHSRLAAQVQDFWALLKFRQTALLLITGLTAYVLTRGRSLDPRQVFGMAVALFAAIGGCTALNMVLDRDIDARMGRTVGRPLAAGRLGVREATLFGVGLSAVGLALAFGLSAVFGLVVTAGFLCDLLVYTAWLKRRTPLSILLGGVSGGMPALAGRVLALGRVDGIGLLLAGSILLWIPSHILTLAIRYAGDYRRAGVPVWPNVYGLHQTRLVIAVANLLNTVVLMAVAFLLRLHPAAMAALFGASLGLLGLSAFQLIAPTEKRNWLLFKLASVYMVLASLLLVVG